MDTPAQPGGSRAAGRRPVFRRTEVQGGALVPDPPLEVPDGTRLGALVWRLPERARRPAADAGPARAAAWLFAASLLVYGASRLIGLERFPIYFFADEAIHAVLARQLVEGGLRDGHGTLLPTYFQNYLVWNLGLSVYAHAVSVWLFGVSVFVTRATSALVGLAGVAAVALYCREGLGLRRWWAAVLVLGVTPAWFLHSRTAFETAMMVSLYAVTLLCYLRYRQRGARWLAPTLLAAGATFYAYSNGQAVIGLTGLLLLVVDWPAHARVLRRPRVALPALALVVLLALPYVRFRMAHPEALATHLRVVDSYLLEDLPTADKAARFVRTYAYGLSPSFWLWPNGTDPVRHRMRGAHLPLALAPLLALGLALAARRRRDPAVRVLFVALLAAPFGAALARIGVTRALALVVPAAMLTTWGLDAALGAVERRLVGGRRSTALSAALFVALAGAQALQLRGALVEGPTWHTDYGLYGMQYGAIQLFEAIPDVLADGATERVVVSPSWANGFDQFRHFFLEPEARARVATGDVAGLLVDEQPDLARHGRRIVYVMTPDELAVARGSPKLAAPRVERTLALPDGRPGFHFVRTAYTDEAASLFAAERAARRRPVTGPVDVGGETWTLTHPTLDSGRPADMFDGDRFSLARVMEANPAVLELALPAPRAVTGVALDLNTMDVALEVVLYPPAGPPVAASEVFRDVPPDPHVELTVPGAPPEVNRVRVTIEALDVGPSTKIHLRELALLP